MDLSNRSALAMLRCGEYLNLEFATNIDCIEVTFVINWWERDVEGSVMLLDW
jgi:hypothetical protein